MNSLVNVGTGQNFCTALPSTFFPSVSMATNDVYFDIMLPWQLKSTIFFRLACIDSQLLRYSSSPTAKRKQVYKSYQQFASDNSH